MPVLCVCDHLCACARARLCICRRLCDRLCGRTCLCDRNRSVAVVWNVIGDVIEDVIVTGGREVLERHDRLMCRTAAAHRFVVARGHPGADVGELSERHLEQRQVGVAAAAVAAGTPDAGEDRERGDIAAAEVDERGAALGRRAVGLAGDALPPRETLGLV